MDEAKAQQLSRLEPDEPDGVCRTLRDSGYGELADEWIDSCLAFEQHAADQRELLSKGGLQAYARMKLCWYKILQVRDQALQLLERKPTD